MIDNFPPYTLLDWLKDFCKQLDCPEPEIEYYNLEQLYWKNLGAWQTQQLILAKLKYAIETEEEIIKRKENG